MDMPRRESGFIGAPKKTQRMDSAQLNVGMKQARHAPPARPPPVPPPGPPPGVSSTATVKPPVPYKASSTQHDLGWNFGAERQGDKADAAERRASSAAAASKGHKAASGSASAAPSAPETGSKSVFKEYSDAMVSEIEVANVSHIDRVRAVLAMAEIGHAASRFKHTPAAIKAAANSLRTGDAFKGNVYADDVSEYLPSGGANEPQDDEDE